MIPPCVGIISQYEDCLSFYVFFVFILYVTDVEITVAFFLVSHLKSFHLMLFLCLCGTTLLSIFPPLWFCIYQQLFSLSFTHAWYWQYVFKRSQNLPELWQTWALQCWLWPIFTHKSICEQYKVNQRLFIHSVHSLYIVNAGPLATWSFLF